MKAFDHAEHWNSKRGNLSLRFYMNHQKIIYYVCTTMCFIFSLMAMPGAILSKVGLEMRFFQNIS